jgi:hypothetical protein
VGVFAIERSVDLDEGPTMFLAKLVLFAILESGLIFGLGTSPGRAILSIRQASEDRASSIVPRDILRRERWWTLLFGVLSILDGAKMAVRGTTWAPPAPFMGFETEPLAGGAIALVLGCIQIGIGVAVLRQITNVLGLALAYPGLHLVSTVLSWPLLGEWARAYVIARRTHMGQSVDEEMIQFFQAFMPLSMLIIPVVQLGLLVLIRRRFRTATTTSLG